jgi:nucleotide-binding universal stress UspA family protein
MLNTVAVGTDGSPTASTAVEAAIDLAHANHARLVVISSYRTASEERLPAQQAQAPQEMHWAMHPICEADAILQRAADRAQARGLNVTTLSGAGDPADVLCDLAAQQNADVLVIGNKGMQRRPLGSVPNSVAHKASCSVMIVKTT